MYTNADLSLRNKDYSGVALVCVSLLGVRIPLRSRHFPSVNFRHFHKNIRVWAENEWCCSRTVNISNVNFTSKYLHRHSQYSNTRDSKCLALVAQVGRIFGMNWGSIPPQVGTFSVSKSSTLSQEHPFMSRKWILLPEQLAFQMLTLLYFKNIQMLICLSDIKIVLRLLWLCVSLLTPYGP